MARHVVRFSALGWFGGSGSWRSANNEQSCKGTLRRETLGMAKARRDRKQRQLRAYDDEWDLLKKFDKLLKHGDREACEKFLAQMEKTE